MTEKNSSFKERAIQYQKKYYELNKEKNKRKISSK